MAFDPTDGHRESILLAELQHRVRSTLATTRLIARRSAETSANLEDYVAHLDGRLAALARVQNLAIRDPLAGIDLGLLVTDELTSAGFGASVRAHVEGPPLPLHPRAAEPVAMALHELTTNAIKFGALAGQNGRLAVSWRIEAAVDEPLRLQFSWIETGLSLTGAGPRTKGFGTLVLQEVLKHNLGAQADMVFKSTGLDCRIDLPLTERVVAADWARGAAGTRDRAKG